MPPFIHCSLLPVHYSGGEGSRTPVRNGINRASTRVWRLWSRKEYADARAYPLPSVRFGTLQHPSGEPCSVACSIMPRRSADIGASTSRPLIRRRERNRCSQLLFFLVFYVANEDPRRATRPQRVPSKPDHPHLKASTGRIGSGGWIRTSDQLINSQLRYHCATPEQSSDE